MFRCDGDVMFLWGFLWELNTAREESYGGAAPSTEILASDKLSLVKASPCFCPYDWHMPGLGHHLVIMPLGRTV